MTPYVCMFSSRRDYGDRERYDAARARSLSLISSGLQRHLTLNHAFSPTICSGFGLLETDTLESCSKTQPTQLTRADVSRELKLNAPSVRVINDCFSCLPLTACRDRRTTCIAQLCRPRTGAPSAKFPSLASHRFQPSGGRRGLMTGRCAGLKKRTLAFSG